MLDEGPCNAGRDGLRLTSARAGTRTPAAGRRGRLLVRVGQVRAVLIAYGAFLFVTVRFHRGERFPLGRAGRSARPARLAGCLAFLLTLLTRPSVLVSD